MFIVKLPVGKRARAPRIAAVSGAVRFVDVARVARLASGYTAARMSVRASRVWFLLALLAGCERRNSTQDQPVVQQPTWPAPVQVQPGMQQPVMQQPVMQQPGVQAASPTEQRLVWAEQRIARLEQQNAAVAQDNQNLHQQLAQTQMELRATQQQMRVMQSQGRAAQRAVRGMMQNSQQSE